MTQRPSKRERREAARRAHRRRQRVRWGVLVGAVAIGAVAFLGLGDGGGSEAAALAPDFELKSPAGETVRLSDFRGAPVALTFMHTD